MEKEKLKKILTSLDAGKFEVEINGPTGISQHLSYLGTTFLRLNGDGVETNVDAGTSTVFVECQKYVCDLNTGLWSDNNMPLNDSAIVNVLNNTNGILSGEHSDGQSLAALYAKLHQLPLDIDYCWSEGENLKDVCELGESEVELTVRYSVLFEGGWDELDVTVDDELVYMLYRYLLRHGRLSDYEYEVEDGEIKKIIVTLYEDIINQIEAEYNSEEEYHFTIPLSRSVFNSTLFGEIDS